MYSAGVIPIDRLTNVRAPIEVVVRKAGVRALQDAYHVRLPRPVPHEDPDRWVQLNVRLQFSYPSSECS